MANLLENPPRIELRRGIVHIVDEYGDRAMPLGVFVAAATRAFALAQQWVSETAKPAQIGAAKRVKGR